MVPDAYVVDRARIDKVPISPNTKRNYALALALAFFFPTAIVFLLQLLDSKIRTSEDVAAITSIPVVASIGHSDKESNLVVNKHPKSSIAESFRGLRSNLPYMLKGIEKPVLAVSSSVGGEGKTFTAMNLASVLALLNKRVVLIGVDLRKPRIFEDFGLTNEKGLSNYLSLQENEINQILQTTKFAGLSIISSGQFRQTPLNCCRVSVFQRY